MMDTPYELDAYCCILADGDFPTHPVPLRLLREAPRMVCCDGAARHVADSEAFIVGDGDSVPPHLRSRLVLVSEQDDNDLTKATRFCLERGWRRIVYLGATGRREDHTLGNLSLIVRYYTEMGVDPILCTDYGWFVPAASGTTRFESFKGQQVSIFNFGCTELSTEGLVYPGYAFQQWWQGTLNEAAGTSFSITANGAYLVFRTYQQK
jgi:thiamine pyrophosphokinase